MYLGSNVTYASSLNLSLSEPSIIEVQEVPLSRKVSRLLNCEKKMYALPLDAQQIRTVVVPEVTAQRLVLAPNYPDTEGVFGVQKENLISDWISNYPSEYESFISYFESYLRNH